MLTGERAADFTLKTLDGDTVGLRSLQGNVVVLDFWATWCGPCRAELPTIEKLRSEFAGAVRFYGVNDEAPGIVKKFAMGNRYEMPILLDEHTRKLPCRPRRKSSPPGLTWHERMIIHN